MSGRVSLRSAAVTLTAAVAVAAMTWLGLWQLGVYDDHQRDDAEAALERAAVPIDEVLGPDDALTTEALARPVVVTGQYAETDQLYVRDLDGADQTYAVVTPLVTATGSAVLVVRGSSDSTEALPPGGPVRIEGVLEPSNPDGAPLDSDRVTNGINVAALVSATSTDLYGGYVIATSSVPTDELMPVTPPTPDASRWAGIRNLLYAIQWWLFAAFVVFMWWRILNEARDSEGGSIKSHGR